MLLGVQVPDRGGQHPGGADRRPSRRRRRRPRGRPRRRPAAGHAGRRRRRRRDPTVRATTDPSPRLDQRERRLEGVLVQLVDRAVPAVADHATVGAQGPLGLDVRDMLHADDDPHPRNVTARPGRGGHPSRGRPREPGSGRRHVWAFVPHNVRVTQPSRRRRPPRLGVHVTDEGVDVAVYAAHATGVDLCLFDDDGRRAPDPAGGPGARRVQRLGPRRPARPAVRLPGARPVGPGGGPPVQPGQAAGRPVRPRARRRGRAHARRRTATSSDPT